MQKSKSKPPTRHSPPNTSQLLLAHSSSSHNTKLKKTNSMFTFPLLTKKPPSNRRVNNKKEPRDDSHLTDSNSNANSPLNQMIDKLTTKIAKPQPLQEMLTSIVYTKPFSEVNKDILRLIRRVSILMRLPGKKEEEIFPAMQARPEFIRDHGNEGVYIVMQLMEHLLRFFEPEEEAERIIENLNDFYKKYEAQEIRKIEEKAEKEASGIVNDDDLEQGPEADGEIVELDENKDEVEFNVLKLIEIVGGDRSRTGLTIRCIHQSVAISGHLHIKSRVSPLMTKDVRNESGWQVVITLAEYVQVRHTRRESSIDMPGQSRNHWEVQFDVHVTFDKMMREITGTKLTITDLHLSETMDGELANYLKKQFNDGNLVVC